MGLVGYQRDEASHASSRGQLTLLRLISSPLLRTGSLPLLLLLLLLHSPTVSLLHHHHHCQTHYNPHTLPNTHVPIHQRSSLVSTSHQRGCEPKTISRTPKMPSNRSHSKIEVQLSFSYSSPKDFFAALTDQQMIPMFSRGEIVYILPSPSLSSSSSSIQPKDCKKLWVWQCKYDEKAASAMTYLLKDGPGQDAKDVEGWVSEDRLREWYEPKEEEPLIDLS